MALVKLTDISVDNADSAALSQGYLYKDLFLDLETSVYYNPQFNKSGILKDVQGLFDIPSIKNSIANIFLTSPGQKILNPTFGIDLRRYLFDPVSDFTAYQIKNDIENNLTDQEPRIQLERTSVLPDPDRQEYYITLQINVPALNAYGLSLKSLLNSNGYYVL
jgi:phage baseplate assembly protein W